MNAKEWAERLNRREYREEMTAVEEKQAAADGVVIVFGASDDLIEFRGVIHDELGAWDGGVYKMTAAKDVVRVTDHSADMHRALPSVRAVWSPQTIDLDVWASWEITTDIPHETFDILEDGELYCRGVVFAWVDAFPTQETGTPEYHDDRPIEPAHSWEDPAAWAAIAEWEAQRADRAENEVQLVRDYLRVHGVSDERIGKAAWRGIDVLETRYRKDINAAMAEIAALTFIPSGREAEIRCCFAACYFGQGLTETGRCSGGGNPRDPSCKIYRGAGTSDAPEQNCRY